MKIRDAFPLMLLLFPVSSLLAQSGYLDNSFSSDGIQVTDLLAGDDEAYSIALQSDGKMVVAGYAGGNFGVTRYNTDGTLDNSFGSGGKVITDFGESEQANSVAIQTDGKIVAAGWSHDGGNDHWAFALARYNSDGSLDGTFGGDGMVTTNNAGYDYYDKAYAVAIQPDGKIVAAGSSGVAGIYTDFSSFRYNPDGSLDNTFGTGGIVTTNFFEDDAARAIVIQPDGKILESGYRSDVGGFALCRYNSDGILDSAFGTDGKLSPGIGDVAYAIALQADGKIVAVGNVFAAYSNFVAARFNSDGSIDSSFSSDGKVSTYFSISGNYGQAVAIQPDGKIVEAGYTHDYYSGDDACAIARYTAYGFLDTSFNDDGKVTLLIGVSDSYAYGMALQSDNKIIVVGPAMMEGPGNTDFSLARFNSNGFPDSTFSEDGVANTPIASKSDYAWAATVQADDKLVVVGSYGGFVLTRYKVDGTIDSSLSLDGIRSGPTGGTAKDVAIQDDGKIILAGYTDEDFAVARYLEDGTPDSTFSDDGYATTDIYGEDRANAVAIQTGGKIILAGYRYNNYYVGYDIEIARYNPDGSVEAQLYNTKAVIIRDIALQDDGKIIFIGDSSGFCLMRYNSNLNIDNSFGTNGKVITDVDPDGWESAYSAVIQPDGKIVVAGFAQTLVSQDFALVRYNSNGSIDSTFGDNGKVFTDIDNSTDYARSLALQSDGKIVVGGYTYSGGKNDFALARYNTDGSLDYSFGINGKVITTISNDQDYAYSVNIQSDGKIILAGTSNNDFAIARYIPELALGVVEFSDRNNSPLIYPNPISQPATLRYTLQNPESISIRLLDLQGRVLKTFVENEKQDAGDYQQSIDLPEELPAASYLIVISNESGGKATVKVVK